jgi:hypothetical protein
MLAENFIQGGTTTFKKSVLEKIDWPAWLKKSNDYFINLELLRPSNNYKLGFIDEVLYFYRWHKRGFGRQSQRSLSTKKSAEKRWELDNQIRQLHPSGLAYISSELNSALREIRTLNQKNADLIDAATEQARLSNEEIGNLKTQIKYYNNSRIVGPAIKFRDFITSLRSKDLDKQ